MSVYYDVVYKDGKRFSVSSVCFGRMGVDRWFEQSADPELIRRGGDEIAFIQFKTEPTIHRMWYSDSPKIMNDFPQGLTPEERLVANKVANRKFLEEMKELYDDLPMLKGLVTIHPLLGVIRVHIKKNRADKIMLALFLFRNLSQYSTNCYAYRYFRIKGYRPRLAATLCHLFVMDKGSSLSGWSVGNQHLGEYNWVNPKTFGKESFLRMMRQDEDFNYIQAEFREQRGYYREGRLSQQGIVFDTRYIGRYWDAHNNRVRDDGDFAGTVTMKGNLYYAQLVDCLSISGDTPICESQLWNCVEGFSFPEVCNESLLSSALLEIEEFLSENNISISI